MTRYKKTMSEAYGEVYNLSEKMSSSQIAKLKKAYEPMRGKKISTGNAEKLMKIMDMVDKDKNVLIQLFKADIPFVSELAVTRLITKHKMKGAEINKLKSEALDKEDEPKVKEIIKKLKGASQAHAGQANDLEKAIDEEDGHFMYKDGEKVMVKTKADHDKYAKMGYTMDEAMLNLATVKFQAKDALGKIRHKVTQKGKKYIVSVDSNDEEDAQKAMKDHPLYVAGKLRVVPEEVELEEKFSPKEIKMAIGIASDKRYARGNYTGAVNAIEKIKKGLSKHKQVAAVLKRQNEELDESKEALKKKAEKSGVSVGILSKVYDRGMAAWKGGHRPGTTPQQWALARVNSFLTGGGARKADNDLWQKAKKEEVELDEDAVKSAQDKLDKAKRIQSLKDRIKDIRDEGARSDAMRAMRTKKGVDPADVDDDATDDDMKAASKNILMQLRKSVSLGKNFKVEFGDKKKMPVDPKIAQAVINKYMSFRKPMDKEKFQSKIAKSYKDMILTMKENIHEEEDKPDNTKFTDRIKKAQERVKNATKGTQEHSDALDALKNAKDAYAEYRKKTTGGKVKSALKKAAVATGIGAIATAKLGDSYDPKIKRETILDRIDKMLEEKKDG